MTEAPTESAQEQAEPAANQAPSVSDVSVDSPPSVEAPEFDLKTELDKPENQEILKEFVQRNQQSTKDSRIAGLEKNVAELRNYLPGVTDEQFQQAQRDMVLDQVVQERLAPSTTSTPSPNGNDDWTKEWQAETNTMLQSAQDNFGVTIDRNSPAFQEIERGNYRNTGEAYTAVMQLVSRVQKGEQIPAAAAIGEGAGGSVNVDTDALGRQLAEEMASPTPDLQRVEEIRDKLKAS